MARRSYEYEAKREREERRLQEKRTMGERVHPSVGSRLYVARGRCGRVAAMAARVGGDDGRQGGGSVGREDGDGGMSAGQTTVIPPPQENRYVRDFRRTLKLIRGRIRRYYRINDNHNQ